MLVWMLCIKWNKIYICIEFNSTWHSKWMYLLSYFRCCPIHVLIFQTLVRLSPSLSWRLCHDNEGKISTQAMICRESLSFVTMRIFVMHKWGVEAGETYSLMSGSHKTHNQTDPRSVTDWLVWDQPIDRKTMDPHWAGKWETGPPALIGFK